MVKVHEIKEFIGKVITDIKIITGDESKNYLDEYIYFKFEDYTEYIMGHAQECCESVKIKEISGNLRSLLHYPIVKAECVTNENESYDMCQQWTFYKISTEHATVTISWEGESNCYYSIGAYIYPVGDDTVLPYGDPLQ